MYFVYILASLQRERYYIGCSSSATKRLAKHNAGSNRSTKPYRPWVLIHAERFEKKSDAMKREWHLKHPAGYLEKNAIIAQYRSTGGFA
jgi:putative endonuclease